MTASLTNETAPQKLGSANLFWPSGFDVTAASVSTGTATLAPDCALSGSAAGPCVQLRGLSLDSGASATVTLTVQTAAPCGSYTWQVEAKQANDFKGQPGNGLDLDSTNSNLGTQVSSPCAAALAFQVQPHAAQTGNPITGADNDTSGPPVTVELLDQNGNPFTSSNAPITIGLGDHPAGAKLSGTKTIDASAGVATFGDLSVDTPGDGYTLDASSPRLTGATSTAFNVSGPPITTPPMTDPVYGQTANVKPVSGVVCIKFRDGTQFHRLAGLEQIPVGSIVDVSNGKAKLFSAKTRDSSQIQHGLFSRGPFQVTQAKNGRAYTKLTLLGFTSSCASSAAAHSDRDRVYNHHRRRHRRLYGSGDGKYRTSGHHGSGSTTGKRQAAELQEPLASTRSGKTKWLTENRRNGTYFRVDTGTLVVRDFTRNRKVRLHAGQHYLAPAGR